MDVQALAIPDVKLIVSVRYEDERGYFSETWNRRRFARAGLDVEFVQDNQSLCRHRGTVRGLHFQRPPWTQAKLVRVLSGSILDVAVDLRRGSPSYGQHVQMELNAQDMQQLFVPAGFAHGFCALEDNTTVLYKVDNFYSAEHDSGVYWRDDDLSIAWPVSEHEALLSEKDRLLPAFQDLVSPF